MNTLWVISRALSKVPRSVDLWKDLLEMSITFVLELERQLVFNWMKAKRTDLSNLEKYSSLNDRKSSNAVLHKIKSENPNISSCSYYSIYIISSSVSVLWAQTPRNNHRKLCNSRIILLENFYLSKHTFSNR